MTELDNKLINQGLGKFFAEYEVRFNKALSGEVDVESIASAFTDCFMEANPKGVMCGKNDEKFRAVIPQGMEFYRNIGIKSMKIITLSITSLDDCHSMAKVHWQAFYEKNDGGKGLIDFNVIYFLQTNGEKAKIFAYIAGDEQKVLRERGLIPS